MPRGYIDMTPRLDVFIGPNDPAMAERFEKGLKGSAHITGARIEAKTDIQSETVPDCVYTFFRVSFMGHAWSEAIKRELRKAKVIHVNKIPTELASLFQES